MCQHKAPHREWEPSLKYLGHDQDRQYEEPATLFDDYAGRGVAEREQDMTIAKTMNQRDLKLTPPVGLTPEQLASWNAYYEPRNAAFRAASRKGPTWCAGNTTATCTTTWAAFCRSTRASAGC